MKSGILLITISLFSFKAICQSKSDIKALAQVPKKVQAFPINYCVALPVPTSADWDAGYDSYLKYLTPAIRKTQLGLSFEHDGVTTWLCTPSAIPHAQLDSTTIIRNEEQLRGTWRAVSQRAIRFVDSNSYLTKTIYRTDTLLEDYSADDAFAIFKNNHFDLIVKENGKNRFRTFASAKYQIESGRYMMLYKLLKASSGISQIGFDKDGRLLIHYASVIEQKLPGRYIVYTSVIRQLIFEKQT